MNRDTMLQKLQSCANAFKHGLAVAINLTDAIDPADINVIKLEDFDMNNASLINFSYPIVNFPLRRSHALSVRRC